jgi:hypothetical protein
LGAQQTFYGVVNRTITPGDDEIIVSFLCTLLGNTGDVLAALRLLELDIPIMFQENSGSTFDQYAGWIPARSGVICNQAFLHIDKNGTIR